MRALEARAQPYLFKLRLSKNVKRHIEHLFGSQAGTDAGQGWEGMDSTLALTGWEDKRRVVVLRRPRRVKYSSPRKTTANSCWGSSKPTGLAKRITGYEYAVLVTNLEHEVLSLGQLYRDRADAENTFDELKNQWGWGGFTTHDLHRCPAVGARCGADLQLVESVCPPGQPEARREAITSRPWLMSSVGRRTEHAGQTTITLTGLHAHFGKARRVLMHISSQLQAWVTEAAEQLNITSVWQLCLRTSQAHPSPQSARRQLPIFCQIMHMGWANCGFRIICVTQASGNDHSALHAMLLCLCGHSQATATRHSDPAKGGGGADEETVGAA